MWTVMRIVLVAAFALAVLQAQALPSSEENSLHDYVGVYTWDRNAFVYFQLWGELSGTKQLVAFDESGELHSLYPGERDQFTAGPAAAVQSPAESRIVFQRDSSGKVVSLTWQRESAPPRAARRADTEKREDVHFSNGQIRLGGTLIRPNTPGKHPALILVHASGAEDREYLLPLAHFLVRRGVAVLGYDKRGVGESTGDWKTASFEDLAGDVVAAFEFLKKCSDIDAKQIGILGWSQAGWVMPLAAVREQSIAFLISVSGAGVRVAETTLDETRNEMTARGMRPQVIEQVIALMKLQYRFAETGEGWEEYATARQ